MSQEKHTLSSAPWGGGQAGRGDAFLLRDASTKRWGRSRAWEPETSMWLKGRGKASGRPLRGFTEDLAGSQSQKEPGARNEPSRFMSADSKGEKPRASPSCSFGSAARFPPPHKHKTAGWRPLGVPAHLFSVFSPWSTSLLCFRLPPAVCSMVLHASRAHCLQQPPPFSAPLSVPLFLVSTVHSMWGPPPTRTQSTVSTGCLLSLSLWPRPAGLILSASAGSVPPPPPSVPSRRSLPMASQWAVKTPRPHNPKGRIDEKINS